MNKYGNSKVTINGEKFDSKREARRYNELLLLQKAGKISNIKRQVKYTLIPSQRVDGKVVERECYYTADFVYTDTGTGREVVEDSKGMRTKDYIIKRKLMLSKYGIKIFET